MQHVVVTRYGVPDINAIIEEDDANVESHACIDLVNSFVDIDNVVSSLKSPNAAMALCKHMGVDLDDTWELRILTKKSLRLCGKNLQCGR